MSQFSHIPLEILYSIVGFLSPPDISRFSRTCKQIHRLATPLLWRSCRIYDNRPYGPFLRAILTNPGLGDYIEELGVSDATREGTHEISEDVQLFESAVFKLPLPAEFQDRLKTEIRKGYSEPLLVVIICKLPNLKNLFLDRPERESLICELFDRTDSGEFTSLIHLQKFSIETEDEMFSMGPGHEYGGILNMVHEVQFVHLSDDEMSPTRLQENSSAAEHLHILTSSIGTDPMRVFIKGFRTLRTFNFTFGNVRDNYEHFKPQEAVKELQRHADTLEELTMLYDDDSVKMSLYDLTDREWYMGTDLRQLINLKKLRSGMHSLLGLLHPKSDAMEAYHTNPQADKGRPELVDVLPESIEHLTLLYADARIIPQLQKVEEVRTKQFPYLKKVIVGFCSESTEKEHIQQLEMPGLELVVLYQNKDEREAHVKARELLSWVPSPVFKD